jgi:hypothetical protein
MTRANHADEPEQPQREADADQNVHWRESLCFRESSLSQLNCSAVTRHLDHPEVVWRG